MQLSNFALLFASTISSVLAVPVEEKSRAVTATRYLFSFGDSYSTTDFFINGTKPSCTGNLLGNPSFPGRTTAGGINWVGRVVDLAPSCTLNYNFAYFGATVNYSIAGTISSTIPSFVDQVADWEHMVKPKPTWAPWSSQTAAFAVWFGVNDVADTFQESNAAQVRQMDLANYFKTLTTLYEAGGRIFVLLNAPPVNRTPTVQTHSSYYQSTMHAAIIDWNTRLNRLAAAWEASHAGSVVTVINTRVIFAEILDQPTVYGAPNATCYNSDGTSCLWWNSYHPGEVLHKYVGLQVKAALQQMGFWGNNVTGASS